MPKQRALRLDPAQHKNQGLNAFRRKDYAAALQHWSLPELAGDERLRAALAEAHFRLGLNLRHLPEQGLAHLRRAVELAPNDPRYAYHLGLGLHRANKLTEARAAYARAAELGAPHAGLGYVRGLLELELNPAAALSELPGLSAEQQAVLEPVAALLRGELCLILEAKPAGWWEHLTLLGRSSQALELWRGLAQLADGQARAARETLMRLQDRHLRSGAESVRGFYAGLAAAAAGQLETALIEWTAIARNAARSNLPLLPRLSRALVESRHQQLQEIIAAGKWAELLAKTQELTALMEGERLPHALQLVARQRLAQAAAAEGNWPAATSHWQAMRLELEARPDLGPLNPVLRNLAIAHEAQEQWAEAAEAWAALLKTLPRRTSKKAATPGLEEQRAWLRRRVLDNYRRADQPEAAIGLYKQAIKASPDDLDLRLELAQALLSNQQEIAARNEARRILDKKPDYVPAQLLLAEIHHSRGEWHMAEQLLRAAVQAEPQNDNARRGLARLLQQRGNEWFNARNYNQAHELYTQALELTPDDPQLHVWLADIAEVKRRPADVHTHLEAALATGKPEAHGLVFGFWAEAHNETEARQALARAEAANAAGPRFCLEAGVACLKAASPPSSLPSLFGPTPKPTRPDTRWESWGRELIERSLQGQRLPAEMLRALVGLLTQRQLYAYAAEYGYRLLDLTPDDLDGIVAIAMLYAMSQDKARAKELLKRAEKLARQQNRKEIVEHVRETQRMLDDPLFGILGPSLFALGPGALDELDEWEDDFR